MEPAADHSRVSPCYRLDFSELGFHTDFWELMFECCVFACPFVWKDELRARRNQESTNREWRRKELELAEKKAQEEAMLKVARLEQVQYREHFLSMEAGREKADFERVLK